MIPRFELLGKLLDVAHARQRVIAQNIANVNTPGYRQLEVRFEDAFVQQMDRKNEAGAIRVIPQVVEGPGGAERVDGNNVDIDSEIARLQKNTMLMNAYTQILASRIAAQRTAISGR